MTKILAIDMGKFKSVACVYDMEISEHTFKTVMTSPQTFHDLFVEQQPDRIVIEVGSQAGWVCDLAAAFEIPIQVANPNHEGWRWKTTKRKTDRDDALKLAQLSAMNQLPMVQIPKSQTRQWRSLIAYRHSLVSRCTAIKNSVRSILDRQGLRLAAGKSGWTIKSLKWLSSLARPLVQVDMTELWRGQLDVELEALAQHRSWLGEVNKKLDALAASDERVKRLQSIPGVGPRLSEMVVAIIDDPKRFKNRKQIGAYAGLVPKQYESGTMQRQGRITGQGNKLLRGLLVEVGWLMRRYNGHFREVFDKVCCGSKSRRKIAVVAVARRLLVCCWAMLRDGSEWREPSFTVAQSAMT